MNKITIGTAVNEDTVRRLSHLDELYYAYAHAVTENTAYMKSVLSAVKAARSPEDIAEAHRIAKEVVAHHRELVDASKRALDEAVAAFGASVKFDGANGRYFVAERDGAENWRIVVTVKREFVVEVAAGSEAEAEEAARREVERLIGGATSEGAVIETRSAGVR